MSPTRSLDAVFFDIGGTLGERDPNTGDLVPYPSTPGLLAAMRDAAGLRIGVITTLGEGLTSAQGLALLQAAGLAAFLDPHGFVSDHDAGAAKPDVRIYSFAASRLGVPVERCLFIGENLVEVIGALAAGMKAILKPSPPGRGLSA